MNLASLAMQAAVTFIFLGRHDRLYTAARMFFETWPNGYRRTASDSEPVLDFLSRRPCLARAIYFGLPVIWTSCAMRALGVQAVTTARRLAVPMELVVLESNWIAWLLTRLMVAVPKVTLA